MYEDDDTVPHAVVRAADRPVVDADEVEAVLGDTVLRPGARDVAEMRVPASLPPVPAALRPHHQVRVGDAAPIDLDRPIRFGRLPRAPRTPHAVAPQLVPVASPDGGISASHLELQEQGAVVVATDLRTTNGSEVRVPGSPARALRRGESIVVTPGTRIDLGEGVVLEVLGPDRGGAAREVHP